MASSTQVDIGQIVGQLARRYAARCWWADEQDLVQEGWLAALAVDFDELDPARASGWVYRVVACRMSRYLWQESSPVSGGRDRKQEGLFRAPLTDLPDSGHHTSPEALCIDAESRALSLELRAELRERLRLLGRGAVAINAVILVLLDGMAPSVAAELTRVDVAQVYRDTAWIKRASVEDLAVRVLLEGLSSRREDLIWT